MFYILILTLVFSPVYSSIPDNQDILAFLKASIYEQSGHENEALSIFTNLSSRYSSPTLEVKIITLYIELKQYNDAINRATSAIQRFPKEPAIYLKLGSLLEFMDEKKAEEIYLQGIKKARESDDICFALVRLYKNKGNVDAIYNVLKSQLKNTKNKVPILIQLGEAARRLNKLDEAKKYLLEAYKLGDRSFELLFYLYTVNNNPDGLKYLYEMSPRSSKLNELILAEQLKHKQYQAALETALELRKEGYPDTLKIKKTISMLTFLSVRDMKPEASTKFLEDLFNKGYVEIEILELLSEAYAKNNNLQEEERILKLIIKLFPEKGSGYNNLGYRYVERNINIPEAIQLIMKAIDLEPQNGLYYDSLAMAYLRQEKTDLAASAFEKAVEYCRDSVEVYQHYADFLKSRGKDKEAEVYYKKLEELKKSQGVSK
jgi:tetratricopeptide (TPR) repeat protein